MTAVKEMIMGKSLPPFATPSAHPLHPVVHPNHPFSRQISPILHNLRLQLFQNGRQFTFSEEVATGFALYDARICARDGGEASDALGSGEVLNRLPTSTYSPLAARHIVLRVRRRLDSGRAGAARAAASAASVGAPSHGVDPYHSVCTSI